jgi:hypothetical protein
VTFFEAVSLALLVALPLGGICWVGAARVRGTTNTVLDVAAVALYILAAGLVVPLLAVPWFVPIGGAVLLAGAAGLGLRRARAPVRGTSRRRAWPGLLLRTLAIAALVAVSTLALSGRRAIGPAPVDLGFPLAEGTYLVANGGSAEIVNAHLATLDLERARPYRGQSYGVDIVKVGGWGSRVAGISPDEPEGFAIFGDSIRAPCAGRVVRATDGAPDSRPPGEPPLTLEGNHVILDCAGAWIVLAHMQRGTVEVTDGESVDAGDVLGLVGNSGNSDEPHLHVHAQTPGSPAAMLGGEPIPVTFGGRRLVRNGRVPPGGS